MLSGAISSTDKAVQGMNPTTVQAITLSIASFLGVTLVTALGALAATVFGPVTLAVAGIGDLVAALGAFAYVKWDAIMSFVNELASKISEGLLSIPA
jgi:hypothetical protein